MCYVFSQTNWIVSGSEWYRNNLKISIIKIFKKMFMRTWDFWVKHLSVLSAIGPLTRRRPTKSWVISTGWIVSYGNLCLCMCTSTTETYFMYLQLPPSVRSCLATFSQWFIDEPYTSLDSSSQSHISLKSKMCVLTCLPGRLGGTGGKRRSLVA